MCFISVKKSVICQKKQKKRTEILVEQADAAYELYLLVYILRIRTVDAIEEHFERQQQLHLISCSCFYCGFCFGLPQLNSSASFPATILILQSLWRSELGFWLVQRALEAASAELTN